jgi:transposase
MGSAAQSGQCVNWRKESLPSPIKVRWHRDLPAGAKVGAAILSRSCGKWHICFSVETPDAYGPHPFRAAIGINVGLTSLIATSDGDTEPTPKWVKGASRKQRRLQRALARCKRGSKRRLKAKRNLARHSARVANQRRDFTHKLSRTLVGQYSHIAVEDLHRRAGSRDARQVRPQCRVGPVDFLHRLQSRERWWSDGEGQPTWNFPGMRLLRIGDA